MTTEISPHLSSILAKDPPVRRLNYIGSKFKLLDWIDSTILEKTGWVNLENRRIVDAFSGTGIVAHHFRKRGATVISNDAELYSAIISHAFTRSILTGSCREFIERINRELAAAAEPFAPGFITTNYSPFETCERMFFTLDNARKIDYVRIQIELAADTFSEDEHKFLLASLLVSADAVSNVPAVYGCYLKNFKAKALKSFVLTEIHDCETPAREHSSSLHLDVLSNQFIDAVNSTGVIDLVYLDPPYNERQYSKNYFPLNEIAKSPTGRLATTVLKGKTGIPDDCFISPFCKKGKSAEAAFERLFRDIHARWIFLSYSSESLVSQEKMLEIAGKYGEVSVIEREYKRFKSFEYNEDLPVTEYLFCLRKR